jgi:DnaJ-class molecular chaperone
MRMILKSLNIAILFIFFVTVVLGGGRWGNKAFGEEIQNDIYLQITIPREVEKDQPYTMNVLILEENKVKFAKDFLKINLPEGFKCEDIKPIPNVKGIYEFKVVAPSVPGNYSISFDVFYPTKNNPGRAKMLMQVLPVKEKEIARSFKLLVDYKSIADEKQKNFYEQYGDFSKKFYTFSFFAFLVMALVIGGTQWK